MSVTGSMGFVMEKVPSITRMAVNMREIGTRTSSTVMVYSLSKTEPSMMDHS